MLSVRKLLGLSPRRGKPEVCQVRYLHGRTFQLAIDFAARDPLAEEYRSGHFWSDNLVELLSTFAGPGSRVLDLGAHIGTFALAAAAMGHKVVAVDAAPAHIHLLKASRRLNKFADLRVVYAAITERPGAVRFQPASLWGMVIPPGAEAEGPTIEVRGMTGAQLLTEVGWDRLDFLKIDVEGSEVAALSGMAETLRKADAPAILYECNGLSLPNYGLAMRDLIALLAGFGYRSYRPDGDRFVPTLVGDFQPESVVDLVALKPRHEALIAGRIGTAAADGTLRDRALQEARHERWEQRRYIAEALAVAGSSILADPQISLALRTLCDDPDPRVRRAASWSAAKVA